MKTKILLISIPLFIISIFLFSIWKNNNTARIIGFILLLIFSLINAVRGIERWDKGK